MDLEIQTEINMIKQIVDSSEHVLIDEDVLFTFIREKKVNIETENKVKENLDIIVKNLILSKVIKYDNSKTQQSKIELEAAAKLIIYLVNTQTKLPYKKIISYLSNLE